MYSSDCIKIDYVTRSPLFSVLRECLYHALMYYGEGTVDRQRESSIRSNAMHIRSLVTPPLEAHRLCHVETHPAMHY
jgi:hypothetical protein